MTNERVLRKTRVAEGHELPCSPDQIVHTEDFFTGSSIIVWYYEQVGEDRVDCPACEMEDNR
jgi:hypothetical protein